MEGRINMQVSVIRKFMEGNNDNPMIIELSVTYAEMVMKQHPNYKPLGRPVGKSETEPELQEIPEVVVEPVVLESVVEQPKSRGRLHQNTKDEIINRHRNGLKVAELAKEYNVPASTIYGIIRKANA
jgi:hypothetical protein